MGGGGGIGWGGGSSADEVVRRATSQQEKGAYEAEANAYMQDLLADYNMRDQEKINTHLDTLKDALNNEDIGSCTFLFGGSIKKHTYVDGMSDIDILAEINDTTLAGKTPSEVLNYFANKIGKRLPNSTMRVGKLAVTVIFSDALEVQILPAITTTSGLRIAASKGDKWSNVVHPEKFAEKLSEVNKANANGVVPVIKLFKAINSQLPQESQISGYHIESIATNAFKEYDGERSRKAMLIHLTDTAAEKVLEPIRDETGQSTNVDEDMGSAKSYQRQRASASLTRIRNKMKLGDSWASLRIWKELFGDET